MKQQSLQGTKDLNARHNITDEEYKKIVEILVSRMSC